MRSGVKVAIVGGVFVVVASGVGYGGYNLWSGISGGAETTSRSAPQEKRSGPVTGEEVTNTAEEFLAAWAAGESERAGQATNNPVEAGPAVINHREGAKVSRAVITPGVAVGARVPFTVSATVTYEGRSKPWTYASELTVVRGLSTGRPLVDWKPSVIHPKLTKGATLRTGEAETAAVKAVDRRGVELTPEKYPSLGPVLDQLRERYGDRAGGEPGIETWIESAGGTAPATTLLTLAAGKPGELRTTLDAGVQAAAERAVKRYAGASVVAIKPSTGEIRAVANNRADGFNAALEGRQAPGSTMKIVSAAMMLERGLVDGPSSTVECPSTVDWDGRTFHNLDDFSLPSGTTLQRAFARSCNTTFIKPVKPLGAEAGTALGDTARTYFGIGLEWKTGVVSQDGSVPPSTGIETAASYIGQGRITMNALNIASITATAKNGSFRQPIIVAKELDGRELAEAEPLPGSVGKTLRELMRAAARGEGTGARAMAGVGGDKGAKTGSAEVDAAASSNSWFAGFADDLAAAAAVESGGHGGDAAGPIVASVLKAR
ncbi:penicillin-binding transpeptidase domain-containing protein [Streptomyces sp. NPDC054861]